MNFCYCHLQNTIISCEYAVCWFLVKNPANFVYLTWKLDNPYWQNKDDNTDENGLETMPFEIVERNRKDVSTTYFCPIFFRQRLCDLVKKVPLKRKQKRNLWQNCYFFTFEQDYEIREYGASKWVCTDEVKNIDEDPYENWRER